MSGSPPLESRESASFRNHGDIARWYRPRRLHWSPRSPQRTSSPCRASPDGRGSGAPSIAGAPCPDSRRSRWASRQAARSDRRRRLPAGRASAGPAASTPAVGTGGSRSAAAPGRARPASQHQRGGATEERTSSGAFDAQLFAAITRITQSTGRDIGPLFNAAGGAKIITPARGGTGVPIIQVAANGIARLESASVDFAIDATGKSTAIVKGIVLP
jgi:hypothetical protein